MTVVKPYGPLCFLGVYIQSYYERQVFWNEGRLPVNSPDKPDIPRIFAGAPYMPDRLA
jgi:hypothetical protein